MPLCLYTLTLLLLLYFLHLSPSSPNWESRLSAYCHHCTLVCINMAALESLHISTLYVCKQSCMSSGSRAIPVQCLLPLSGSPGSSYLSCWPFGRSAVRHVRHLSHSLKGLLSSKILRNIMVVVMFVLLLVLVK